MIFLLNEYAYIPDSVKIVFYIFLGMIGLGLLGGFFQKPASQNGQMTPSQGGSTEDYSRLSKIVEPVFNLLGQFLNKAVGAIAKAGWEVVQSKLKEFLIKAAKDGIVATFSSIGIVPAIYVSAFAIGTLYLIFKDDVTNNKIVDIAKGQLLEFAKGKCELINDVSQWYDEYQNLAMAAIDEVLSGDGIQYEVAKQVASNAVDAIDDHLLKERLEQLEQCAKELATYQDGYFEAKGMIRHLHSYGDVKVDRAVGNLHSDTDTVISDLRDDIGHAEDTIRKEVSQVKKYPDLYNRLQQICNKYNVHV